MDFNNKTAVITGGASGIGLGLVNKASELGINVIIADISIHEKTIENLYPRFGNKIRFIETDVSKRNDVERLLSETIGIFGNVHFLFNNAGVDTVADLVHPVWDIPSEDWDYVWGINFKGIVNGVQVFLPHLLEHDEQSYIINTTSLAGLVNNKTQLAYLSSKHAVTALTESIFHQLKDTNVRIHLLCPGPVNTPIAKNTFSIEKERSVLDMGVIEKNVDVMENIDAALKNSIDPDNVANTVFQALLDNKFYIMTHDWIIDLVKIRMEDIIEGRSPTLSL